MILETADGLGLADEALTVKQWLTELRSLHPSTSDLLSSVLPRVLKLFDNSVLETCGPIVNLRQAEVKFVDFMLIFVACLSVI